MSNDEQKTLSSPVDVPIDSWPEFVSYFAREKLHGWIYRGLPSADHLPIPRIWRDLSKPYSIGDSRWTYQENVGITYFKTVAPLYVSNLPDDDDLIGWLSLMQHYGAPTRLTDWSMSPFVAAFFAYEQHPLNQDAVIWMLNAAACRYCLGVVYPFGRDHTGVLPVTKGGVNPGVLPNTADFHEHLSNPDEPAQAPNADLSFDDYLRVENKLLRATMKAKIKWPLPVPILRPDARMAAQQGCFVSSGELYLLEEMNANNFARQMMKPDSLVKIRDEAIAVRDSVQEEIGVKLFTDDERNEVANSSEPTDFLRRIVLPHQWRTDVLFHLAKMNITGATLFPGLDGVGRAARHAVTLKNYPTMQGYLGNELAV